MGHIKSFENFRADKKVDVIEEGLFSKTKPEDVEKFNKSIEDLKDKYKEKITDAEVAKVKAKADKAKYVGSIKAVPNAVAKTIVLQWVDAPSMMQKLAAGTGSQTVGEAVDMEEVDCSEYETEEGDDCETCTTEPVETEESFNAKLDAFESNGAKVNRKVLLEKAVAAEFKGALKTVKSKKTGNDIVVYQIEEGLFGDSAELKAAKKEFMDKHAAEFKKLKEEEKEAGEGLKKIQDELMAKLKAEYPAYSAKMKKGEDKAAFRKDLETEITNVKAGDKRSALQKLAAGSSAGRTSWTEGK